MQSNDAESLRPHVPSRFMHPSDPLKHASTIQSYLLWRKHAMREYVRNHPIHNLACTIREQSDGSFHTAACSSVERRDSCTFQGLVLCLVVLRDAYGCTKDMPLQCFEQFHRPHLVERSSAPPCISNAWPFADLCRVEP